MSYYADYLAAKCEEGWGQETDWLDFYCSIFDGGLPYGSKKFTKDTCLAILLTATDGPNEAFMDALEAYIEGNISLSEMEKKVDRLEYIGV